MSWTKAQNTTDPVQKYINDVSLDLHPAQQRLIENTQKHHNNVMLGSADELQLLQNLMRSINAKRCIDIGVYTGYSSLSMALALPQDGQVIACDVDAECPRTYGEPAWKEAGVDHKIQLKIAPAAQTLQKLVDDGETGSFDFAFIDADKGNYSLYYELCVKLVRSGGIIAVDNMLWNEKVADASVNDEYTVALREMSTIMRSDDRVHFILLKVGDGTGLAFKK